MHFNLDFSAAQVLWTLTFAAVLVLMVVLLGRGRAQRFPWFTANIAMMGLLLLTTQLLLNRLPRITGTEIFLALSNVEVAIGLLVLVELARRSFHGLGKMGWIVGSLSMLAVGAAVLVLWGPWPAWKTMTGTSVLATIRLMDLAVDKGILLSSVLTVELGLSITLAGRRFGTGWHSHAQRIVIGLSTAALAQLMLRGSLEAIGMRTHIHSQADYERVLDLRDKLIHANNAAYLCVLVWWITCLWFDEPGAAQAAEETEPADGSAATLEAAADPQGEPAAPATLETQKPTQSQAENSDPRAGN